MIERRWRGSSGRTISLPSSMSDYNETKKEGVRVSYYKSLVAARHWRWRGEWAMALENRFEDWDCESLREASRELRLSPMTTDRSFQYELWDWIRSEKWREPLEIWRIVIVGLGWYFWIINLLPLIQFCVIIFVPHVT